MAAASAGCRHLDVRNTLNMSILFTALHVLLQYSILRTTQDGSGKTQADLTCVLLSYCTIPLSSLTSGDHLVSVSRLLSSYQRHSVKFVAAVFLVPRAAISSQSCRYKHCSLSLASLATRPTSLCCGHVVGRRGQF